MSKKSRTPFYIWLGIAALILVMVILARFLAPYNPNATDLRGIFDPPSASHWLGKDHMGRDVFSRLLVGGFCPTFTGDSRHPDFDHYQ